MIDKLGIQAEMGAVSAGLIYNSVIQIVNGNGNSITEKEVQQREQQYLGRVMGDCKGLEWLNLMGKEGSDIPAIGLDSIYTALLTDTLAAQEGELRLREKREECLSALDVLNKQSRLVITGDPGSGKSALVNYLSLCLSGELLGNEHVNLQALTEPLPDRDGEPQSQEIESEGQDKPEQKEIRQVWDHIDLIPLRIILRDFAASSYFPDDNAHADACQMMDFIQSDLKKASIDYFDILKARLRLGKALVMFDGLNEVPQAGNKRKQLKACIEGFSKSYSDCRILVTCRPYAYQDTQWQLDGFSESKLRKFHKGQIIRFIRQWYLKSPEFDAEKAQTRSEKLRQTIFKRHALIDLAERPLLLSLIAYLHGKRHQLPERRADLYERLLELLIDEWEKARFKSVDADSARGIQQYSLAEFLDIGQDTIRLVLERLAFQAHANQAIKNDTKTADISSKDLTHQLYCAARANGKEVKLGQLYEYLRDRVGILCQRGGKNEEDAVYTFPHRSFQEYLAAAYFRREEEALFDCFADQNIELEDDTWQELAAHLGRTDPDRWREIIVLLGGIKSQKEPGPVWDLIKALSQNGEEPDQEQAWGLRLAVEILAENLKHKDLNRKQQRIFENIQTALPDILPTQSLPAKERASVGNYLSQIGDPRADVNSVDHMLFSLVPAGRFYMGQGEFDKGEGSLGIETPAGEYDLSYDYWLAQNPVTLQQFATFVEETDYNLRLQGVANCPIVTVSWLDVMAFCDWLTQRWHQMEWLPKNWCVSLPDEAEWEKAARGGLQIPKQAIIRTVEKAKVGFVKVDALIENPVPQRRYPWERNEIEVETLNYAMKIGSITTANIYPLGASPYACQDMAGNVWEWTRSERGDYPYPEVNTVAWKQRRKLDKSEEAVCVLRGGAFNRAPHHVRCAVRYYDRLARRSRNIGFRVVLSPLL